MPFLRSAFFRRWRIYLFASLLFTGLTACAHLNEQRTNTDFLPVSVVGMQHMGPDFNVSDFYVDGAAGGNIGRGGGGGSMCCANLPRKWRPGMSVVVRWSVGDWSHENRAEIEAGNYKSVRSGGAYKATVPVEKYDKPGRLYTHFFPGGKVRVLVGAGSPERAIPDAPHDDPTATVGVRMEALFSKEELEKRRRENDEHRKKYGDWR